MHVGVDHDALCVIAKNSKSDCDHCSDHHPVRLRVNAKGEREMFFVLVCVCVCVCLVCVCVCLVCA